LQYQAVYNVLSFSLASMMATTVYLWFRSTAVHDKYKSAVLISGLVTFIAAYHYIRIFNSWVDSYEYTAGKVVGGALEMQAPKLTGVPFNDAYRYVDWLLTVPLLLIELILVMKLPQQETVALSWKLGLAAAVMVALGYPGEIQDALLVRWVWWALSMVPFCYVVSTLIEGLNEATSKQPESVKGLLVTARYLTAVAWLTYPFVYLLKNLGLAGAIATTYEQVGYSIADVVAKAVFGLLIWAIAAGKSEEEDRGVA